jgi:glycosyltransferase involved in cell wall biosynthesis
MSKKKLLILTDKDFIGGAETNYRELIPAYQKAGVVIYFVSFGSTSKLSAYFNKISLGEIKYHALPQEMLSLRAKKGAFSLSNLLSNVARFVKNRNHLKKLIAAVKPTGVISNSIFSHIIVASLPANKNYKRLMHLQDIINTRALGGLYGKILNNLVSKIDYVITISDAVEASLPSDFKHKYKKLYNPVTVLKSPATQVGEKKSNGALFKVGMFARYVPWKGHHHFINIAEMVHHQKPNSFNFVAYGNFTFHEPYYKELKMLVKEKHLQNVVKLSGFAEDVSDEMASCDVILHLSVAPEPFGRVLIEANANGTPVVAFKDGGVEELFQNLKLAGKLIQNGDEEGIVKTLLNMNFKKYTFPELRQLQPEKYVEKILTLLEK